LEHKDFPSGLRTTPTVEKSCFQDSNGAKALAEAILVPNGVGKETEIRIYLAQAAQLPVWITCSGSRETFIEAGALGTNVLTSFQEIEELAKN